MTIVISTLIKYIKIKINKGCVIMKKFIGILVIALITSLSLSLVFNSFSYASETKPWENKKIIVMGDSITASTTGWINYFKANVKPQSFINVAVNSAKWVDASSTTYDGNPVWNGADNNVNNVIGNQVQKILNNNYDTPDIIIIAAGANDISDNTVIETQFTSSGKYIPLNACNKQIIAGAMRYCIETLLNKYPNTQIFISLPIQSAEARRSFLSQQRKCNIIKSVANRMSIPIINSFEESGIYGANEIANQNGKYLIDGLHPNPLGSKLLGDYISRKIINWYCF
jgi:lysophospholipase L1-like esterase